MTGSRSVRAFVLILVGYGAVRTAVIFGPPLWNAPPAASSRGHGVATVHGPPANPIDPIHTVPPRTRGSGSPIPPGSPRPREYADRASSLVPARPGIEPAPVMPAKAGIPRERSSPDSRPPDATGVGLDQGLRQGRDPTPNASRWSGYAYVFHRPDRGGPGTLAPAGQIGGSQAAARVAYRIADRVALSARITSPLRATNQAEVAAGVELAPIPGLRVVVERRAALGRSGRNAWSAYAAAGAYRSLGHQLELDAYVQAGLVGARTRDPFADGALRIHHRTALAPGTDLRLGAAAWGATQPGAARLDIGPRAAVTRRIARLPVTLAVEGRTRIAGRARPGNGVALTLATDF